ncbi:hypothetical protein D3C77_452930 [compost metagenome]
MLGPDNARSRRQRYCRLQGQRFAELRQSLLIPADALRPGLAIIPAVGRARRAVVDDPILRAVRRLDKRIMPRAIHAGGLVHRHERLS